MLSFSYAEVFASLFVVSEYTRVINLRNKYKKEQRRPMTKKERARERERKEKTNNTKNIIGRVYMRKTTQSNSGIDHRHMTNKQNKD